MQSAHVQARALEVVVIHVQGHVEVPVWELAKAHAMFRVCMDVTELVVEE